MRGPSVWCVISGAGALFLWGKPLYQSAIGIQPILAIKSLQRAHLAAWVILGYRWDGLGVAYALSEKIRVPRGLFLLIED